jgi:hypothetical protein
MTIVVIDGRASGSGPFDEGPTLYESAQTEDNNTPAACTIACLDVASSRAWFGRLRAAA